jgi:hypothetical protein
MDKYLAVFSNNADGVSVLVCKGTLGYNVLLRDDDSGEFVGTVLIYDTLEGAKTKAQAIVA